MKILDYFLFSLMGYVMGSILTGYILVKCFCNKNIFSVSKDHNPGTANAFVYGNFLVGTLTLIFDLAKGFIPVFWAKNALDTDNILFALVVVSPILGHCFPLWNSFDGGKGIAVSFGVGLGFVPENFIPLLLLCFFYIFFSVVIKISPHKDRSIVTYFYFGVVCALFNPLSVISLGFSLISTVVIIKHIEKYREKKNTIKTNETSEQINIAG